MCVNSCSSRYISDLTRVYAASHTKSAAISSA